MNQNKVLFKGRQNGIVVVLDPDSEFDILKVVLQEKLEEAKDFFGASTTHISFDGRKLTEDEENELLEIITENSDINISFFSPIESISAKTSQKEKKEEKGEKEEKEEKKEKNPFQYETGVLDESSIDANKEIYKQSMGDTLVSATEGNAQYHFGSLRSGQSIEYRGSVVVIGDVNPGAEVIAEGHIIVLGALRGLVHAGCLGMSDAFVAALRLEPIQLRISSVYTYIPEEKQSKELEPSIAYVEEGKIFINPLIE